MYTSNCTDCMSNYKKSPADPRLTIFYFQMLVALHVNQEVTCFWTFEKSTIYENWLSKIEWLNYISEPNPLHSMSMVPVLLHKTFRVYAFYFRVTLQMEGLVIKRSVTEVLMEMSCLDIQCDKHQVIHIQVSLLTRIYHTTVGANWILIPKYIYRRHLPWYFYIFFQSYFR